MKKILVFACALLVAGPGGALAQAYYYPQTGYNYGSYSGSYNSAYLPAPAGMYAGGQASGCTYISSDLSYGSQGSEVSTLQQFLVHQNYPGAGSWMVTGYFGRATETALRTFQASRGLIQTGVADAATRAAMRGNCLPGLGGYQYDSSYPYTYPNWNQYAYQTYPYQQYPYYPYQAPLRLDSLSTQSSLSGSSLTLYGSGFDPTSNTVRFGTNAAAGAGSTNGTSLTVTVPNVPPGVYAIYVTNGRGTSNSLTFTVTGNPYGYYNYGYNYGYNYPYNNQNYYPYNYDNYNYGYNYNYNYNCMNYPYGCY